LSLRSHLNSDLLPLRIKRSVCESRTAGVFGVKRPASIKFLSVSEGDCVPCGSGFIPLYVGHTKCSRSVGNFRRLTNGKGFVRGGGWLYSGLLEVCASRGKRGLGARGRAVRKDFYFDKADPLERLLEGRSRGREGSEIASPAEEVGEQGG